MDALIKIALSFTGSVIENKDTLLLIGIFFVGLKQVFQTGKKQAACDQIHKSFGKEIDGVKKETKEALSLANKAHNCTIIMEGTVTRIEKSYNDLITGKYGIEKEETN